MCGITGNVAGTLLSHPNTMHILVIWSIKHSKDTKITAVLYITVYLHITVLSIFDHAIPFEVNVPCAVNSGHS